MRNGIYALANPYGAGGTLSLNEEFNIKTDNETKFKASFVEALEKYVDEPVIGENTYENNKTIIAAAWGVAALLVVGAIAVAACVVTGGLAAGLVVAATAAVVGGVGATLNYLGQKANGVEEIDWCSVAISGFSGAISGAVAATPLGVPGQMLVNGVLGGAQSLTTGGSWSDITFSTGIGLIAGWLGGAGPKWTDTNVFLPRTTVPNSGAIIIHSTSTRFWHAFKTIWTGLDSNLYVTTQFSGLAAGFIKGTLFSNAPTYLPGIIKHLWEKYYTDTEEENECDEEEDVNAK